MIIVTIKNIKVHVISSSGSLNIGTTINILFRPEGEPSDEIAPPPTVPPPIAPPPPTPPQPIVRT